MVLHGYTTNYIDIFSAIQNFEEHLNRCIGSKVKVILLNGWILPTGVVALGRVCPAACATGLFLVGIDSRTTVVLGDFKELILSWLYKIF